MSTPHIPDRFRRLPRCAAFGGSARNDGSVYTLASRCVICTSYQYGASGAGDKRGFALYPRDTVSARNDGGHTSAITPKTAHVSARLPRCAPIGRSARNDGSCVQAVSARNDGRLA
ncbi:MAG: hypothetical protein FWF91_01930 [Coriobacteriia bacterium]|nr:hypothetical protein [Coriobacteriia bacterium]